MVRGLPSGGGRVFPLQGIPLTTVLPNGLLPTHWAFLFQKSPNSPSWEVPYALSAPQEDSPLVFPINTQSGIPKSDPSQLGVPLDFSIDAEWGKVSCQPWFGWSPGLEGLLRPLLLS